MQVQEAENLCKQLSMRRAGWSAIGLSTEAVAEIWVRDKSSSSVGRYFELFRVYSNVHSRSEKCAVPQKRVQRADDQDHRLFPVRPLGERQCVNKRFL